MLLMLHHHAGLLEVAIWKLSSLRVSALDYILLIFIKVVATTKPDPMLRTMSQLVMNYNNVARR